VGRGVSIPIAPHQKIVSIFLLSDCFGVKFELFN